ncbi:terminase [Streptomyces badius]
MGQSYGKLLLRAVVSGPKAHAVRWDMRDRRNQETFTDAVKRTREDILQRQLIHDGHKVMPNHVINAAADESLGVTIRARSTASRPGKIHLAICMIGARMLGGEPS